MSPSTARVVPRLVDVRFDPASGGMHETIPNHFHSAPGSDEVVFGSECPGVTSPTG
jgi:hypothetical protein